MEISLCIMLDVRRTHIHEKIKKIELSGIEPRTFRSEKNLLPLGYGRLIRSNIFPVFIIHKTHLKQNANSRKIKEVNIQNRT
jgi:hypothetical protein